MKIPKQIILVLSCALSLLMVSCKKEPVADLPTERTERLLEIYHLFEKKDYKAVIPKIEKYQELDETNTFLGELYNIAVTNYSIQEADKLAQAGDFEKACASLDQAIANYGQLPNLLAAEKRYKLAMEVRQLVLHLKQPQTSENLRRMGYKLRSFGSQLKRPVLTEFGNQAVENSVPLRQLETDRAGFLIFCEAQDLLAGKQRDEAFVLASVLQSQWFSPAVTQLHQQGLFYMDLPDQNVQKGDSGLNNNTNKK